MSHPARSTSLRRTLLAGSIAFGAAATGVLLASSFASNAIRKELDANNEALRTEQRIADHIVGAAYGQQLAAFRYMQNPSAASLHEFRLRGAEAYGEIRKYLFREMPRASRLKVEQIKEVHQEFEVAAQRAFDLADRADLPEMRERVEQLTSDGDRLEATVRDFIRDREQQGILARARLERRLLLLQVAQMAGAILIALSAVVFAGLVRQRVVVPLSDLADAVRRVGDGEADVKVAPQRDAEFRQLADHVELMARRIRAARQEAEERNAALSRALGDLQRAQQELVQREKLSAMGEMLAGLAHELNNPLAGVLGLAELLKADVSDSPNPKVRELKRELVDPLVTEAVRARDLVRNLLHFARASESTLEPVRLAETVDVAVGLCRHRFAQQRTEIRVEVPAELHVIAQTQKLEHAIINVVSNALHAIDDGAGTGLTVRAVREGASVMLHFEDDGPGFSEVERAFDPFYTTKPVGEGTGLGLSLVHRFLQEFGGSVRADNRAEGGARVTFVLEAATGDSSFSAAGADAMRGRTPEPAPRRRVLVAEDEPALREIQRRVLVGLGLEPVLVANGRDAIGALEQGEFDLVISDLRMPGDVSGLDLLAWLDRERPHLARTALIVTGDISGPLPDEALAEERVLTKPFRRDEYEARVKASLERSTAPAAVS